MVLKMSRTVYLLLVGMSVLLTGCVSTQPSSQHGKILVEPITLNYKMEITLAKLNEILASAELTAEQRARFYYDRGVIYDSVGLRMLSRIDFHQALKLQPDLADAYNFIGIYYTQEGQYEGAYEAFDAVLELSPQYDYAYLNRGIALYYGNRNELAIADMKKFLQRDPSDGYRVLWLYLTQSTQDLEEAQSELAINSKQLEPKVWSTVLVRYYLGELSLDDVFAAAKEGLSHANEYAERLCETYFYAAKIMQQEGDLNGAANYFRLALATNIFDFVEHRYSRLELRHIKEQLASESGK